MAGEWVARWDGDVGCARWCGVKDEGMKRGDWHGLRCCEAEWLWDRWSAGTKRSKTRGESRKREKAEPRKVQLNGGGKKVAGRGQVRALDIIGPKWARTSKWALKIPNRRFALNFA